MRIRQWEKAERTLGALVNELRSVLDEVPWDIHKLLHLVRHDEVFDWEFDR